MSRNSNAHLYIALVEVVFQADIEPEACDVMSQVFTHMLEREKELILDWAYLRNPGFVNESGRQDGYESPVYLGAYNLASYQPGDAWLKAPMSMGGEIDRLQHLYTATIQIATVGVTGETEFQVEASLRDALNNETDDVLVDWRYVTIDGVQQVPKLKEGVSLVNYEEGDAFSDEPVGDDFENLYGGGDDELPDEEKYSLEDWRSDVACGDTKLGYDEWVRHQKNSVDSLDTIPEETPTKGVFQYLDCSTAHITREADEYLQNVAYPTDSELYVVPIQSGYWLYVGGDEPTEAYESILDELPSSILEVMKFAHQLGIVWVKLDSDGETHEKLPTYDWDAEAKALRAKCLSEIDERLTKNQQRLGAEKLYLNYAISLPKTIGSDDDTHLIGLSPGKLVVARRAMAPAEYPLEQVPTEVLEMILGPIWNFPMRLEDDFDSQYKHIRVR